MTALKPMVFCSVVMIKHDERKWGCKLLRCTSWKEIGSFLFAINLVAPACRIILFGNVLYFGRIPVVIEADNLDQIMAELESKTTK